MVNMGDYAEVANARLICHLALLWRTARVKELNFDRELGSLRVFRAQGYEELEFTTKGQVDADELGTRAVLGLTPISHKLATATANAFALTAVSLSRPPRNTVRV
jgi:hypothetical protein